MKQIFFTLLFISLLYTGIQAQELYYLEENFETIESTDRWENSPTIPFKVWEYTYGGQWESGGNPFNPQIPKQGNLNAGMYFPSLDIDSIKLVSPFLELGSAGKPTLRFWHCQYDRIFTGPDFLRLLFRSSPSADWDVIESWTTDIPYWDNEIYDIASIDEKYLTDSFQLAFEGIVGNGYGVYLDSVTVKEDTIVQKFVKSSTFQSIDYDAIPAGATNIPLENIIIRILGNSGNATLDSLTVIPSGDGLDYLETDSFKLFYTKNDIYSPVKSDTSTQIATASFVNGKVVFADVNYELALGDNHLWLVASFESTQSGTSSIQFSIPAQGINVSDTLFPSTTKFFNETHYVFEAAFYDDFESGGSSWFLDPNFEVGKPTGIQVGSLSNPSAPFNGSSILATNLNGGYLSNITTATAYYAYTPVLDLKYYINTRLYMHRNFAINGPDSAIIEVSTNGGVSWNNIFSSDPSSNNTYWKEHIDESLSTLADRHSQFQLRFGIVESNTVPWPGLSIDNFAILSEKLNTDVGITEVIFPYDDCLDCGNDTVRIWVKNYAEGDAPTIIPVFFGLWGQDSIVVHDTIFGGISQDDSTLFTFTQTANFPQGDYYDEFVVGIDLASDQYLVNNKITKPLIIQNNITPAHFEDFEYKGGIWIPKEGSSWENKDMSGTITTDPKSPHVWVLSPTGNYRNNDTSFVISNCYNLSEASRNIISFKYWSDSEVGKDGARFEYSINNGATWEILNDPLHNTSWNWTINNVSALGSPGWSGTNEWIKAQALIPDAAESFEKVKFRLLFMSDGANSQPQGFAFNDFDIFKAPHDIGVSAINIPTDACQFDYPGEINLWVKNFGFNDLHTDDTLIIGYDFETDPAVIDTFRLASDLLPGDSVLLTLSTSFNVETPGNYQIQAYTLIEDDPWFYGYNNDTTTKLFETWQNPTTGLEDTISTRQPDTLMIEPIIEPEYTFLWGDLTTTSSYDVEAPGTYYLTVTESIHGCQTYDSIFIELLFNDVGIDSVIWPQSSCELSSSENIQVQIRNYGTDSLIIDDKILLYYKFNGEPLVADSVTLEAPLYSGAQKWFTFSGTTEDLSSIGDYSLVTFTDYGGDTIPENDTIFETITVHGYPELDLGNDTVIKGLSYMLEVDPTFESYLWNDRDTIFNKLIDTSGVYWLDINDIHGCPASDTIDIWFRIRDIRPVELLSPVSSCDRLEGSDEVVLRIENNGSDTIGNLDAITVGYQLDNGAVMSDILNLDELLPGDYYDHTFSPKVTLTDFGSYEFNTTAVTSGDIRTENDTALIIIQTNVAPEIDLGVDDTEIYYQTEMVLDAGFGDNYSYLWQDGSTNRTYTVTDITTVEVLVTDTETGCIGGDTAFVYLDILDYMISNISLENSSCAGSYNDMAVTLLNNGNLPRQTADITLQYYMNGSLLFTNNYSSGGTWPAGATRTHPTQNEIDLEEIGSKQLEIVITSAGDLRPDNDSYSKTIEIIPAPDVDFGENQLAVDFPYTLDAGSGHQSYLWSNGSSGSTFTATEAGTYSVTVTGTNGCTTVESVYLDTELSINSLTGKSLDVEIYPNPTQNLVTIEVAFSKPGKHILEVFNSQNSLFISRELNDLEYKEEFYVGDLPAGLYFIRIRDEQSYHVSKMIIQ